MKSAERKLKESFLDIIYHNNMDNDGCSKSVPSLLDWYVEKDGFTHQNMKIKLNFENPVYVSSGENPCRIEIIVRNKEIFQSKDSGI